MKLQKLPVNVEWGRCVFSNNHPTKMINRLTNIGFHNLSCGVYNIYKVNKYFTFLFFSFLTKYMC